MKPVIILNIYSRPTRSQALFKYLTCNLTKISQLPYMEVSLLTLLGIRGLKQREFKPLTQGPQ